MEPCGTPAQISAQYIHNPFKMAICFLVLRKPCNIFTILSQIPLQRSAKINPPPYFVKSFGDIKECSAKFEANIKSTKNFMLSCKELINASIPWSESRLI